MFLKIQILNLDIKIFTSNSDCTSLFVVNRSFIAIGNKLFTYMHIIIPILLTTSLFRGNIFNSLKIYILLIIYISGPITNVNKIRVQWTIHKMT